jgi:LssY C-terminus
MLTDRPDGKTGPETQQLEQLRGGRRDRRFFFCFVAIVLLYLLAAYVIVPLAWKRDVRRHPELFDAPRVTHTPGGIPGDPVNIALVGSQSGLIRAMTAAKWYPADPITFRNSARIAVDSVFRRPDDDAPVSTLELFGRRQDLAFEQPVGDSPRQRHHVRFWRWDRIVEGREVWFGAVTFDERVGLSHTTGQVTHHIAPNLDAERDRLIAGLRQAGVTQEVFSLNGFQQLKGRNGGGDPWYTDGRLEGAVLTLSPASPVPQTNSLAKP